MKVDGKLYAISYPQTTLTYYGLMARKDLLDAKGYSYPQTLEEYYDAMKGTSDKQNGVLWA